ncbi:MAG: rod shape-determining protein MreC [Candidatus Kaiserbacteria bacterium]|nr:rod shape-determining protein MreC [Candidatus Kaiserbacteria bacterium]MCB9816129.1 rod shape-determining protein MreC [Candidatus Nomurabacteria bacterium]
MKARSRHNSSRRRLVQIVVVSVALIGLGVLLPRIFSTVSAVVMYPIHVTNVWLEESTSLVPSFIRTRKALTEEIAQLEDKLVVAGGDDVTMQRLSEENNLLRRLLGVQGEERIAAAVIARPNELPYDLLEIDRGTKHGVAVGAPVYISEDVVIGLVVHAAETYSFVELITTPGFKATAFISGPNVVVHMEGYGGGVARVRVPQGIPITKGNLVYLPSIDPGVFGRISYVENEPTQPEQYGYITPELAISGLHYVAVGTLSQISKSTEEVDENILSIMRTSLVIDGVSAAEIATTTASTTATSTDDI